MSKKYTKEDIDKFEQFAGYYNNIKESERSKVYQNHKDFEFESKPCFICSDGNNVNHALMSTGGSGFQAHICVKCGTVKNFNDIEKIRKQYEDKTEIGSYKFQLDGLEKIILDISKTAEKLLDGGCRVASYKILKKKFENSEGVEQAKVNLKIVEIEENQNIMKTINEYDELLGDFNKRIDDFKEEYGEKIFDKVLLKEVDSRIFINDDKDYERYLAEYCDIYDWNDYF